MISVLIPTRHHLDKLPRAVDAILRHTGGRVEVLLGVDDDDAETTAWARSRPEVAAVVEPRPDTLGAVINTLSERARGDLLLGLADDMEVLTPDWDVEIERVARQVSPRGEPFAFFLNDPTAPGFPSVWGVNRAWARVCGFACAPWFPYWWGDTWIMEVGMASGRLFPVPVLTGQIAERGGTTGLRDVAWWSDFFARTRPLRMQMAEAIARAAHPADVQRRLKSIRPQVSEQLAQMQAQIHTAEKAKALEAALSSESGPSERYVRAKAAAARLLEDLPRR